MMLYMSRKCENKVGKSYLHDAIKLINKRLSLFTNGQPNIVIIKRIDHNFDGNDLMVSAVTIMF